MTVLFYGAAALCSALFAFGQSAFFFDFQGYERGTILDSWQAGSTRFVLSQGVTVRENAAGRRYVQSASPLTIRSSGEPIFTMEYELGIPSASFSNPATIYFQIGAGTGFTTLVEPRFERFSEMTVFSDQVTIWARDQISGRFVDFALDQVRITIPEPKPALLALLGVGGMWMWRFSRRAPTAERFE
jgi:hypothetical protein